MKKFVIFSFIAFLTAVVFTSCDEAKSEKKVGNYTLTEKDGKFGLSDGRTQVLPAEYDNIEIDNVLGIVVAKKGDFWVIPDAVPVIKERVSKIEPAADDYTYLHTEKGMYLFPPKSASYWGRFEEISLQSGFLFFKDDGKWGLANTDHVGLAPRQFEQLYVLQGKDDFYIAAKDKNGWQLYNHAGVSDGVRYSLSNAEITAMLKPFKLEKPYGVIKADIKL